MCLTGVKHIDCLHSIAKTLGEVESCFVFLITVPATTSSRCSGYFQCHSGETICMHQRCDDIVDCKDMTDERSCHDMKGALTIVHAVTQS